MHGFCKKGRLMNTPITFTPSDIVQIISWVCGAIITLSATITILIQIFKKLRQPEQTQNDRITTLEKKVERHDQLFDKDNKRLIELEKGNRVTQQALLALLSHAINGTNETELKEAKAKLESYLIGKED